MKATLTWVVLTWCAGWSTATAAAPPVAAFTRLPPTFDVQLSPDGTRAVMLRAIGETYHAVLADFAAKTMRPLLAADPEEFLFNWCRWANADRIVCSIRSYGTRRRSYETLRGIQPPTYWYQGTQGGSDAPRVNRMTPVQRAHGGVRRWHADRSGALTLGFGYRGTEMITFGLRDRLHRLDLTVHTGARAPVLAALAPNGASAYLIAGNGRDTRGLYRIDTTTGNALEALHVDVEYDVDGGELVLHSAPTSVCADWCSPPKATARDHASTSTTGTIRTV